MNILIVTEVFYPENFHVNDFAKAMVERGHHVKVMTRQPAYPAGHVYPGYSNDKYSVEKWGEIEIHRFDIIEGYRDSKLKKIENYFYYVKRGKQVISQLVDGMDALALDGVIGKQFILLGQTLLLTQVCLCLKLREL